MGVTKLLVRGLNRLHEKQIQTEIVFPDLSTSTHNHQHYDYRFEIRPEKLINPSRSLDPTLMLEIMIEGIDREDRKDKIIGYAYFPLFLSTDGRNSSHSPEATEYIFTDGNWQIPVYYRRLS